KVKYSSFARKHLKKLPKNAQFKVVKKIRQLKVDPFLGKKLRGDFKSQRSFKAWPYRIIYHYLPKEKLLFIDIIEHKQQVYK
ncbi:hypothetical protein A3J78_02465, partial [Candidatus Beckwithbacteria bacterium RBG_13_35_6]